MEILGEKAFPEGLIDILIKEAVPMGIARKIIIEVKASAAKEQDLVQLKSYRDEIAEECVGIVPIAKKFSSPVIKRARGEQIKLIRYTFNKLDEVDSFYTFEDLLQSLRLEII